MKKIDLVSGARPNLMKVAPLFHELEKTDWAQPRLVHTGQHYSPAMSQEIFEDLSLPPPSINLGIGSGSHADQTGKVMIAYESLLQDSPPDWVVVVGDVNSTVGAAIATSKLGIPVAHLEAGLRSFDRRMPEEINRILVDAIADILWTPSPDGNANLLKEGRAEESIRMVGNIMIDSLELVQQRVDKSTARDDVGLTPNNYVVVTIHRPSNVDQPDTLSDIVDKLVELSQSVEIVFPVHPRTKKFLEQFDLYDSLAKHAKLVDPLRYIDFMNLVQSCRFVITDSGGIQEETSYLGIPCLTLRENTERPITIEQGTNKLVRIEDLLDCAQQATGISSRQRSEIALWDGNTSSRIVTHLAELCR